MSGPVQEIDFNETQKFAADLFASTWCNGGADMFLEAQADLLKNLESAMAGWLHRRQQAIAEAHRLLERLRDSRDVIAIWNAQQEWANGALQRFAADVAAYPSLFPGAGQGRDEAAGAGRAAVSERAKKPAVAAAVPGG